MRLAQADETAVGMFPSSGASSQLQNGFPALLDLAGSLQPEQRPPAVLSVLAEWQSRLQISTQPSTWKERRKLSQVCGSRSEALDLVHKPLDFATLCTPHTCYFILAPSMSRAIKPIVLV